jgi:hypothetical protein
MRLAAIGVVEILLAEAALLVVLAPLAGVFAGIRVRSTYGDLDGFPPLRWRLHAAGRLARALIARATILTIASAAIAFAVRTSLEADAIWRAHALVWAAALALMALGAACSAAFAESLDAAACAVGLAVLVGAGVFAAGPALDRVPRTLLEGALIVNPVVATAAAANVDIFRMEPLYRLSPLAHTAIEYPEATTAFVTQVAIAVILTMGTRGPSRKRTLSVERTAP